MNTNSCGLISRERGKSKLTNWNSPTEKEHLRMSLNFIRFHCKFSINQLHLSAFLQTPLVPVCSWHELPSGNFPLKANKHLHEYSNLNSTIEIEREFRFLLVWNSIFFFHYSSQAIFLPSTFFLNWINFWWNQIIFLFFQQIVIRLP